MFETPRAARSGWPTYASNSLVLLMAVGCAGCLMMANVACSDAPGATLRRMKVAILNDPAVLDTAEPPDTAPADPTPLPNPKASTTTPPAPIAADPAMLEIWQVLDDLCDPILTATFSGEPRPTCATAAYLPEYADNRFCDHTKLQFHSLHRLDRLGQGLDETYLVYDGCEPSAGNEGGSIIAVRTERGWALHDHRRGDNPDACIQVPRRDGGTALACIRREGKQGAAFDLLSVVGLDAWERRPEGLYDDLMIGCDAVHLDHYEHAPVGDRAHGYETTWRRFEGFETRQEDDGPHLIVTVSYGLIEIISADDDSCHVVYPDRPDSWDYRYAESAVELSDALEIGQVHLDYREDGGRLVPTDATEQALERILPDGRRRLWADSPKN